MTIDIDKGFRKRQICQAPKHTILKGLGYAN